MVTSVRRLPLVASLGAGRPDGSGCFGPTHHSLARGVGRSFNDARGFFIEGLRVANRIRFFPEFRLLLIDPVRNAPRGPGSPFFACFPYFSRPIKYVTSSAGLRLKSL